MSNGRLQHIADGNNLTSSYKLRPFTALSSVGYRRKEKLTQHFYLFDKKDLVTKHTTTCFHTNRRTKERKCGRKTVSAWPYGHKSRRMLKELKMRTFAQDRAKLIIAEIKQSLVTTEEGIFFYQVNNMPYVTISTNLPKEEIPSNFTVEFAEELARILDKRIQTMTIILHSDLSICRFGKSDPALCIMLRDVQPFDNKEKNRQISKDVISFMEKNLNIESARMSIIFEPDDPSRVGLADGVLLYDRHAKKGKLPSQ